MQQPSTTQTPPPHVPSIADDALMQLDLNVLAHRCASEGEAYRRTGQHDTRYGYELFRRALVKHDQEAWAQVYDLHRSLVECWVRRCSAFAASEESCESLVLAAFARLAHAISPERFASFPTLASLLRYLRCCTESIVLDSLRTQRPTDTLPDEGGQHDALYLATSEPGLERVTRQEFWHTIARLLNSEAERVVVLRSFMLGLRPNDIYAQRRDLFASVDDVYSVKRNVLIRLRRNMQLQHLLGG